MYWTIESQFLVHRKSGETLFTYSGIVIWPKQQDQMCDYYGTIESNAKSLLTYFRR